MLVNRKDINTTLEKAILKSFLRQETKTRHRSQEFLKLTEFFPQCQVNQDQDSDLARLATNNVQHRGQVLQ